LSEIAVSIGVDQKDAIAYLKARRDKQIRPARRRWKRKGDSERNCNCCCCKTHCRDRPQAVSAASENSVPRRMQNGCKESKPNYGGAHCSTPEFGGMDITTAGRRWTLGDFRQSLRIHCPIPPPALPGSGSRGRPAIGTSQPRRLPLVDALSMVGNGRHGNPSRIGSNPDRSMLDL
jgi:hypothetical protein